MVNSILNRVAFRLYEKKNGRHILKRQEELNCSQWLSHDALMELQHSKLQHLVEYAYQYMPYYQRIFDQVGFKPSDLRSDIASLTKLPILTKSIVRENWNDLLTTEPGRRQRMTKSATSGSTGLPLILMHDGDFHDVDAADTLRHIGWAGWNSDDWQAWIWGHKLGRHPRMIAKIQSRLLYWARKRFIINAYMMTEQTMTAFAQRIRRQRPSILFGYATGLYNFAQFISRSSFKDITFKGIFSTAEVLPASLRNFIEDTFRTRVFNSYATLDVGIIACECEAHTGLHVSMENNYVEILRNGTPAEPGQVGDIIVTNLINLGMPFIRYSTGDAGAWYRGGDCPCGRVSAMLQAIEGRSVDTFKTRDGRVVMGGFGDVDYIHDALPYIKQFQVVQKSLDNIVFRIVPDGEIPQPVLDQISQNIRNVLGQNVVVQFEFLDAIQPLPSGKHRYAVSEVE